MKIKVTEKVVQRMIDRAKRNFMKSKQPREHKNILGNVEIFVIFNKKLGRRTYGLAYALNYQSDYRISIGLTRKHKRYLIDGRRQHLVIELNPGLNQKCVAAEVFDTVSHELAHCLDFILRGYIMDRNRRKGFHDEIWKDIHKAMGGSGLAIRNAQED